MVFISLDTNILPHQRAGLEHSYIPSRLFELDTTTANNSYQIICDYLLGNQPNQVARPTPANNAYPLLLHANSISAGVALNYYPYLTKQVGSSESRTDVALQQTHLPCRL